MTEASEPGRRSTRTSWVARVLFPLALVAVVIAFIVIVSGSMDETTTIPNADSGTKSAKQDKIKDKKKKDGPTTPRTYVVKSGDSLSSIAIEYGVSVKRLERLNPDVDSNALVTGTEITLR